MIHSNSRWWYWVAGVPAVVAFWLASAIWVGVSVWLTFAPAERTAGLGRTAVLAPLVALGVPLAAVLAVLPYALFRDGRAVRAAGSTWPRVRLFTGAATLADFLALVGLLLLQLEFTVAGALAVVVGVLLAVAVSIRYVRSRREHVHMPATLHEWSEELRAA